MVKIMEDKIVKKCFVMMPISDVEGYDKGHFTRVYEHLIKPAVEEAGFKPQLASDTSKANFIVVDILKQILDCDMAICDLSSRNPNVFYELGIRQAFNLRTVLIKDSKTAMPFDISGIRTLPYSESLRIDEVKKDIPNLTKCIKETYESDSNEVNSLLQLLSIDKPAMLPEKVTLSQDSSMILNAINDLNKKINVVNNSKDIADIKNGEYVKLPNGQYIIDGTPLYFEGSELGKFVSMDDSMLTVRRMHQGKIQIVRYKLNDEFLSKLTNENPNALPF